MTPMWQKSCPKVENLTFINGTLLPWYMSEPGVHGFNKVNSPQNTFFTTQLLRKDKNALGC